MSDIIGGNNVGKNSFGSTVVFDALNNRVFNHEVFGVSKRIDIAVNNKLDIVIDPISAGTFPKRTFVFMPFYISTFGAGPINIDVYVNPVYSGGTEVLSIDRNFDEAISAHTKVFLAPTVTNDGIKTPYEDRIESSAGQGNSSDVAGAVKEDFIIIPLKTVPQMIRLTNTDTVNAARGVVKFNWFEV